MSEIKYLRHDGSVLFFVDNIILASGEEEEAYELCKLAKSRYKSYLEDKKNGIDNTVSVDND